MPNRHSLDRVFRLGLAVGLFAVAFGWGPAPAAAAPAEPPTPAIAPGLTAGTDTSAISLNFTVGTDASVCATTSALDLTTPAEVTYCYEVTNTGTITLTSHMLVNSISGVLLNDFPYQLVPGASAFLTDTAVLTATRVTSATWTAYNAGPVDIAISTDTAAVNIGPLFGCNVSPRTFETGLPGSWVVDDLSPGVAGIDWTTTADTATCGHNNLTNGTGEAACADSDQAGEPSDNIAYDTALLTNQFDLTHAIGTTLHLSAFYSDHLAGNDLFRIEVWNGKGWFPELTWDEEHSNEDIDLDLSTYDGVAEVRIRFRYSGPGWDWYAQVDNVSLSCGGRTYLPLTRK